MMRSLSALLLASVLATACGDDYVEPSGLCVLPIDDSPVRGAVDDAWVTVVEFSDFACPFCALGASMLQTSLAEYAGDLRVAFKHLPLHDESMTAAVAAECAKDQDRFWELHDIVFTERQLTETALQSYAAAIPGLDAAAWNACREDAAIVARVSADEQLAREAYVSGTPTFFVNGSRVLGADEIELRLTLEEELDRALASGLTRTAYYESLLAQGCELDVP